MADFPGYLPPFVSTTFPGTATIAQTLPWTTFLVLTNAAPQPTIRPPVIGQLWPK